MKIIKFPIRCTLGKVSPSWLMPPELSTIQPVPTARLLGPHADSFPQRHWWPLFHDSKGAKEASGDWKMPSRGLRWMLGWKAMIPQTTADMQWCASPTTVGESLFLVSFFSFSECASLSLKAHVDILLHSQTFCKFGFWNPITMDEKSVIWKAKQVS